MTKTKRTLFFLACLLSFLLLAPFVVLYSQGYRMDFQERKIVQTGAIYLKVWPGEARVYLNGDFEKKVSGFSRSLLIKNLLPKKYSVEVKKDGYQTWQKELRTDEKKVTEAKNIILFPENPEFTLSARDSQKIETMISKTDSASATSSDQSKRVEFNSHEIWISFLQEEPEKVFLTRFSQEIGKVFWLNDHYLAFNAGESIKVAEIDKRDRLNIIDLAEFGDPELFWNEEEKNLYVLSKGKLYASEKLLP